MPTKLKNVDLAAMVTMAAALIAELAVQLSQDQSLLAMLPDWLGPLVLAVAAAARWRVACRSCDGGAQLNPDPAVPAESSTDTLDG